ncbi:hypothetical protein [Rothia terrae]|uniref:hypothetical protein n=1 Tax=Rothia terrae TaxID=396015 RepID=UPI0033E57FCE
MFFTELAERVITAEPATRDELEQMLTAPEAQTFTMVDAASSLRYRFFQNTVKLGNLYSNGSGFEGKVLEIAPDLTNEDIAADIAQIAGTKDTITVDFLQLEGHNSLPAMRALRILAATRVAAPRATLVVGEGRADTLQSLQPLALHIANALVLADREAENGTLVLADLTMITDGRFKVLGAENRDLLAEHKEFMDAHGFALPEVAPTSGGCGGNCACGSGGCGA